MRTNEISTVLDRVRAALTREAMRVTPLWVTIAAVALSAAGPALAWRADTLSRERDQLENVVNCRLRNDGIRNGGLRIDTLVRSLEREVGGTQNAHDAGDRIRADQEALPDNRYVDCDGNGDEYNDFSSTYSRGD